VVVGFWFWGLFFFVREVWVEGFWLVCCLVVVWFCFLFIFVCGGVSWSGVVVSVCVFFLFLVFVLVVCFFIFCGGVGGFCFYFLCC